MKSLQILFEDDEHEFLTKLREKTNTPSWRQFILDLVDFKEEKDGK